MEIEEIPISEKLWGTKELRHKFSKIAEIFINTFKLGFKADKKSVKTVKLVSLELIVMIGKWTDPDKKVTNNCWI